MLENQFDSIFSDKPLELKSCEKERILQKKPEYTICKSAELNYESKFDNGKVNFNKKLKDNIHSIYFNLVDVLKSNFNELFSQKMTFDHHRLNDNYSDYILDNDIFEEIDIHINYLREFTSNPGRFILTNRKF